MTSVIGYVRASTTEQEETIKAQQEKITAYCAMRGLTLAHIYIDHAISGTVPLKERKQGELLLEHLDKRGKDKPTGIVAVRLDRLFRNAADCLANVQKWDKQGLALHLIDLGGQSIDTSSAAGRFFITVIAGAAEMERNLISERTAAVLQAKRARGEVYNHTPYGWDRDGDKLHANESEQAVIAEMRSMRAQGLTLRAIAARLTEQGTPTKRGLEAWSHQAVAKVLKGR